MNIRTDKKESCRSLAALFIYHKSSGIIYKIRKTLREKEKESKDGGKKHKVDYCRNIRFVDDLY